ncbi:unnamed protein product, partial [Ixodes pacificus]
LDGLHPDCVVRHVEVVEDVAGVVFVEHAVDVQQAPQDRPLTQSQNLSDVGEHSARECPVAMQGVDQTPPDTTAYRLLQGPEFLDGVMALRDSHLKPGEGGAQFAHGPARLHLRARTHIVVALRDPNVVGVSKQDVHQPQQKRGFRLLVKKMCRSDIFLAREIPHLGLLVFQPERLTRGVGCSRVVGVAEPRGQVGPRSSVREDPLDSRRFVKVSPALVLVAKVLHFHGQPLFPGDPHALVLRVHNVHNVWKFLLETNPPPPPPPLQHPSKVLFNAASTSTDLHPGNDPCPLPVKAILPRASLQQGRFVVCCPWRLLHLPVKLFVWRVASRQACFFTNKKGKLRTGFTDNFNQRRRSGRLWIRSQELCQEVKAREDLARILLGHVDDEVGQTIVSLILCRLVPILDHLSRKV